MSEKKHISSFATAETTKSFGFLSSGEEIFLHTLTNKNGMELSVMDYGATIVSLKVPNANQQLVDVVLGFDRPEDYLASYQLPSAPYFGCVVGRFAGRIKNASFELNGKTISLNKNHGIHHLHGGSKGFGQQLWTVKKIEKGDSPSITLEYASPNNEEHFPGVLITEVTYLLTESNKLIIQFNAFSTEDTIVNLTQHSYFNLDGHTETIEHQKLFVNSTKILEIDDECLPTGLFMNVSNCPFDFTEEKKCPHSIDNTFVLQEKNRIAASLYSSKNQLKMSVFTNQPAVHIYVGGNCFGQLPGKEEAEYHTKSGICFETQHFPDSPNHAHFPSTLLKKGEQYEHQTFFVFETI